MPLIKCALQTVLNVIYRDGMLKKPLAISVTFDDDWQRHEISRGERKDISASHQSYAPHEVYIETHLGGGAVLRHKRPAGRNIGIERNGQVINGSRGQSSYINRTNTWTS